MNPVCGCKSKMKTKVDKCVMLAILLLAVAFFALPGFARAATINAADCSRSSLQNAISAASAGDTVAVPAGNCVWTDGITLAKSVVIQGAGAENTTISFQGGTIFRVVGEDANGFRITGIGFQNCTQCIYLDGEGLGKAAAKDFRLDHNLFADAYIAFETDGAAHGVLDHNMFQDSYGARIYGDNNVSAMFPFSLGTSDAVFFEDNTIVMTNSCVPHFIASNSGSRYVVRHNEFTYNKSGCGWLDAIDAHGYCEVAGRGSFTWEVYGNTIRNNTNDAGRLIHLRGGQGVVYDNTLEGIISHPIVLTDYMSCSPGCVDTCSGYPCQDQINRAYFWGNTKNGAVITAANNCPAVIEEGRDFFSYAMPGYAPYAYPHPLAVTSGSDTTSPSPPTGLAVR